MIAAYHFMHEIAERLANRVQLTTDGRKAYRNAVDDAFGAEIDYAQLVKIYGQGPTGPERAARVLLVARAQYSGEWEKGGTLSSPALVVCAELNLKARRFLPDRLLGALIS